MQAVFCKKILSWPLRPTHLHMHEVKCCERIEFTQRKYDNQSSYKRAWSQLNVAHMHTRIQMPCYWEPAVPVCLNYHLSAQIYPDSEGAGIQNLPYCWNHPPPSFCCYPSYSAGSEGLVINFPRFLLRSQEFSSVFLWQLCIATK